MSPFLRRGRWHQAMWWGVLKVVVVVYEWMMEFDRDG